MNSKIIIIYFKIVQMFNNRNLMDVKFEPI